MQMVLQLHAVLESTVSWAEGCSCHGHLMSGRRRAARLLLLRDDFGHDVTFCPMAGLRADEFAVGSHLNAFRQSCDSASIRLAADTEWALAPSDLQLLTSEHELGRQFMELGLKLKTGFWGKLPWLLAGLAHPSTSLARHTARSCVALWEASASGDPGNPGDDPRHLHHRLTKEFLDPAGCLRRDIDRFAQGTPLSQLSERTQQRIACMKFWPTVERTVEASHKDMKMRAGYHRCGPVSLSLSVRATPVLEGLLCGHGGADRNEAHIYIYMSSYIYIYIYLYLYIWYVSGHYIYIYV